MRNSFQKSLAFWLLLAVMFLLSFQFLHVSGEGAIRDFNYSKFVAAIKAGQIQSVTFNRESDEIEGEIKKEFESVLGGKTFSIVGNTGDEGYKFVVENGITPNYRRSDPNNWNSLINWIPIIFMVLMFFFILR